MEFPIDRISPYYAMNHRSRAVMLRSKGLHAVLAALVLLYDLVRFLVAKSATISTLTSLGICHALHECMIYLSPTGCECPSYILCGSDVLQVGNVIVERVPVDVVDKHSLGTRTNKRMSDKGVDSRVVFPSIFIEHIHYVIRVCSLAVQSGTEFLDLQDAAIGADKIASVEARNLRVSNGGFMRGLFRGCHGRSFLAARIRPVLQHLTSPLYFGERLNAHV